MPYQICMSLEWWSWYVPFCIRTQYYMCYVGASEHNKWIAPRTAHGIGRCVIMEYCSTDRDYPLTSLNYRMHDNIMNPNLVDTYETPQRANADRHTCILNPKLLLHTFRASTRLHTCVVCSHIIHERQRDDSHI